MIRSEIQPLDINKMTEAIKEDCLTLGGNGEEDKRTSTDATIREQTDSSLVKVNENY